MSQRQARLNRECLSGVLEPGKRSAPRADLWDVASWQYRQLLGENEGRAPPPDWLNESSVIRLVRPEEGQLSVGHSDVAHMPASKTLRNGV